MRSTIVRILSALALVAAVFAPTAAAKKPAPNASVAKWAKKNHLKGAWKAKDTDRDGLKNLAEFKAGTNPRKADSDRDGLNDGDEVKVGDDPTDRDSDGDDVKDGAEHAGTVTAVSGDKVTIRQFKGGNLTATLAGDADCYAAEDLTADDSSDDAGDDSSDDNPDDGYWGDDSSDDNSTGDDGGDDDLNATATTVDDDPTVVQLAQTADDEDTGADDASAGADDTNTCADAGVEKGALLRSAEVERDGGTLLFVALEIV